MTLTNIIRELSDRLRIFKAVTALTGSGLGVDSVVITNGGSGYSTNFAVTFSGNGINGATGTAIVQDGGVVRVDISARGDSATDVATVDFSAGDGSGAAGTAIMTAISLDAIPTENLTPPILGMIAVADVVHIYQLEAGTDAESSPDVIRPDDYADGTNEKVWKLKTLTSPSGAGAVSGGAADPVADPGVSFAIYIQTNGALWLWFGGAWNLKG